MNDEHLTPKNEDAPQDADDLRFAPPDETAFEDAPLITDTVEFDATDDETAEVLLEDLVPRLSQADAADFDADALDIDAALAAVSTLDDLIAEQEAEAAAQQAAAEEAERLAAEREARMRHPESFFPMPALSSLPRGRFDSVITALAFIVSGIVLTLTLTGGTPDFLSQQGFMILLVIFFVLLVRWLVSQPMTLGNGLFAVALLLLFAVGEQVLQPLSTQWPLFVAGVGAALFFRNLLNGQRAAMSLFAPLVVTVAGVSAWLVTSGQLPIALQGLPQSVIWVVLGLVALILLLPVLFKQRN